jgi:hypothetical protein
MDVEQLVNRFDDFVTAVEDVADNTRRIAVSLERLVELVEQDVNAKEDE